MPDTVLTRLATRARLKSVEDIKEDMSDWLWADEYAEEVLQILTPIDRAWHEENERQKAEKRAKKAKHTSERQKVQYEEGLAKARQY